MSERYPKYDYSVGIKHRFHDVTCTVRTSIPDLHEKPKDLVMRLVRLTHSEGGGLMNYATVPAEAVYDVHPAPAHVADAMTVAMEEFESDGTPFLYYVWPDDAVRVTLARVDVNANEREVTYPNDFLVPSRVFNHDCDGKAIKQLLSQAAYEWRKTQAGTDPGAMTWDDVVRVPNDFLSKYGLHQCSEPDVLMTLTVCCDDDLPAPFEDA